MKNSICIVIPYFGEWPDWIDIFFDSLKRNPSIQFLFYTDCDFSGVNIPNVRFNFLTFEQYNEFINIKLNSDYKIPNAYKICDFRPLFGEIHALDFKEYDFYGWCDLDLVFGNIREFYTDSILDKYDVFSTHVDRISGHFALFRNTAKNRNMYRKIYNYRKALKNPEFVGIDEHGITNAYVETFIHKMNDKYSLKLPKKLLSFLSSLKKRRIFFQEQYSTPFLPIPWCDGSLNSNQPDVWYYHKGKVTNNRDNRSFMYLHFMNFKSSRWRHDGTPAPWEKSPKVYHLTKDDHDSKIEISAKGFLPST